MKMILAGFVAVALLAGCAHEGGVRDTNYRETGFEREPATTGPGLPSITDRDFPGRIGPGMDRPIDPARPY